MKPGTLREHNFAKTDAEFQGYVNEYNRAAGQERRQVAHDLLSTLAGVLGFPVRTQPLAGDDERRVRELGLDWRYLTLPLPPERFEETVRALPARATAARTSRSPTSSPPTTSPTS